VSFLLVIIQCSKPKNSPVIVANSKNLGDIIKETEFVLLFFHAELCKPCMDLDPEFERVARILEKEGSPIKLVKIDGKKNVNMVKKYEPKEYPTLFFFRNGIKILYEGDKVWEDIIPWVKKKAGQLSTLIKAEDILNFHPEKPHVYGVFTSETSEAYIAYLDTAFFSDESFNFTHRFGGDSNEYITLYPSRYKYSGNVKDKESVKKFIEKNGYLSLNELNQRTLTKCFKKKNLFLLDLLIILIRRKNYYILQNNLKKIYHFFGWIIRIILILLLNGEDLED